MLTVEGHNLFNAFFLFAPTASFGALFTPLEAVFVTIFPVMLASAVPKGEGWRSFCLSLSLVRGSLPVELGRVLDGDALRGCVDDVDVASFGVMVADGMLRVGVIVDSTDSCD